MQVQKFDTIFPGFDFVHIIDLETALTFRTLRPLCAPASRGRGHEHVPALCDLGPGLSLNVRWLTDILGEPFLNERLEM